MIFDIFSVEVSELIQNHKSVAIVDGLSMLSSVLNLALTIYPKEISYVDQLLSFCLKCVETVPEADINNITLKVNTNKYSRLSLIGTPRDRRHLFVLSGFVLTGVTCIHLYKLGQRFPTFFNRGPPPIDRNTSCGPLQPLGGP